MADPLGIVASVTGVVAFGFQVSISIANLINDIRDAPQYVLSLKDEIECLQILLQHLERKLRSDFSGSIPYPQDVSADLKTVLTNLERELKKIDAYIKGLSVEGKRFQTWHSFLSVMKRKYHEDDFIKSQRAIE